MHILENSVLVTCGYILPLLIRNTMKMSYHEAPTGAYFLKLGTKSALVTFALGCLFSLLGWSIRRLIFAIKQKRKAAKVVAAIVKHRDSEKLGTQIPESESSREENSIL